MSLEREAERETKKQTFHRPYRRAGLGLKKTGDQSVEVDLEGEKERNETTHVDELLDEKKNVGSVRRTLELMSVPAFKGEEWEKKSRR